MSGKVIVARLRLLGQPEWGRPATRPGSAIRPSWGSPNINAGGEFGGGSFRLVESGPGSGSTSRRNGRVSQPHVLVKGVWEASDTVGEFTSSALALSAAGSAKGEAAVSLHPAEIAPVPAAIVQVAKAAFPKGCPAIRMRDELGVIYDDQVFAAAYPARGQPAPVSGPATVPDGPGSRAAAARRRAGLQAARRVLPVRSLRPTW